MSKRTKAARRNSAEWASLIEAYGRSGLSRVAFAEREGIHPNTFTWWASRLGAGATKPVLEPKAAAKALPAVATRFVPVRVRASVSAVARAAKATAPTPPPRLAPLTPSEGVEVVLSNGRRVRCDLAQVDDPRLAALFALAEGVREC